MNSMRAFYKPKSHLEDFCMWHLGRFRWYRKFIGGIWQKFELFDHKGGRFWTRMNFSLPSAVATEIYPTHKIIF